MAIDSTIRHTASTLPQELIYNIIQLLRDDAKSLSACSRVCKSWCPESLRFLFQTIYAEANRIAGLVEFLGSFEPARHSVRHLHLGSYQDYKNVPRDATHGFLTPEEEAEASMRSHRTNAVLVDDLLRLVSSLPNLETLHLHALPLKAKPFTGFPLPNSDMQLELQELEVVDMWDFIHVPDCFWAFFGAFATIRDLKSSYVQKDRKRLHVPSKMDSLRTLSVTNVYVSGTSMELLHHIQGIYDPDTLKLFVYKYPDFEWDHWEVLPALCDFVKTSQYLEELHLHVPCATVAINRDLHYLDAPPGGIPDVQLPKFRRHNRPRTVHYFGVELGLQLTHEEDGLNEEEESMWKAVTAMLGTASGTATAVCLHVTDFNTEATEGGELERLLFYDWSLLGSKLLNFRTLERVFLVIDSHHDRYPEQHLWKSYPNIVRTITMALPNQVRRLLAFGAYHCRSGDIIYTPAGEERTGIIRAEELKRLGTTIME